MVVGLPAERAKQWIEEGGEESGGGRDGGGETGCDRGPGVRERLRGALGDP